MINSDKFDPYRPPGDFAYVDDSNHGETVSDKISIEKKEGLHRVSNGYLLFTVSPESLANFKQKEADGVWRKVPWADEDKTTFKASHYIYSESEDRYCCIALYEKLKEGNYVISELTSRSKSLEELEQLNNINVTEKQDNQTITDRQIEQPRQSLRAKIATWLHQRLK